MSENMIQNVAKPKSYPMREKNQLKDMRGFEKLQSTMIIKH